VAIGPMIGEHLDLSALKVLVVDDNANTRNLIAEVLRSLGVNKVFKAESASAGRMVLKAGETDLIFADIEMAGENGLEFVRQIRASPHPQIANVVIVMVSAHATESRVIEASLAGANSFLVKPFSVSALARRLAEGFANRKMTMQAAQPRAPVSAPAHWSAAAAKAVEI
jgi:two-component system, chemotaxis family, chemotaxis protein CheY